MLSHLTPIEKASVGLVQDIREEYGGSGKVVANSGGARKKVYAGGVMKVRYACVCI